MSAVLLSIAVLVVAACSSGTTPSRRCRNAERGHHHDRLCRPGPERRRRIASRVHSLVPKGGDVHTFDPSPSDAAALSGARLVVMNGLGLDDWLVSFMQNTGHTDIPIIRLGESLTDVEYIASDEGERQPAPVDGRHLRARIRRSHPAEARRDRSRRPVRVRRQCGCLRRAARLPRRLREGDSWRPSQRPIESLSRFTTRFRITLGRTASTSSESSSPAPGQDPSAGEIADLINAIESSGRQADPVRGAVPGPAGSRDCRGHGRARRERPLHDTLTDTVPTYDQMIRWDTDKIVAGLR